MWPMTGTRQLLLRKEPPVPPKLPAAKLLPSTYAQSSTSDAVGSQAVAAAYSVTGCSLCLCVAFLRRCQSASVITCIQVGTNPTSDLIQTAWSCNL